MIEQKLMEDFARGMQEISDIIDRERPDLLIFPLRGAVPIADLLRIINPSIGSFPSEYMPASSSISETDYVIREWTKNALRDYHVPGENLKILTIDEVKSGQSVCRVSRRMKQARDEYRKENGILRKDGNIEIKSIGIVDLRHEKSGKEYDKNYVKLLGQGFIIPVRVNQNLVMDRRELCPVILEHNPDDHPHYLPTMKEFRMTVQYLAFLRQFGAVVGQNVEGVDLQNPLKIKHSERLLPLKYRRQG